MRLGVFLFCLMNAFVFNAQVETKGINHFDTLYYTSGMIRPCTIEKVEFPIIYFNATNSKGLEVRSTISVNKLKYFVDYDSTGTIRLNGSQTADNEPINQKLKPREDSLTVYNQHLSINPFSPFFLGLNLDYMYRFGQDLRFAVHIPFRVFTWFGAGFMLNTGLGLNYIPFENQNSLMYVGLIPELYFVEGSAIMGFPAILGYTKHLTEQFTFNGYVGVGPKIGKTFNFPLIIDAHIGIGIKLGEKRLIKTVNNL